MGTFRHPEPMTVTPAPGDEVFFREHGYSRAPLLVQWMATGRCGLRCGHCLSADAGGGAELSLTEVLRLLDELAELRVPELLITGGEPFAREDLPEVIRGLGERGLRWSINTARGPTQACRAAIAEHPPSFAAVSLDGPARFHDRFRGREGSHREALEAIRYFGEVTGGEVAAGTTITRRNVHLLEETFAEVAASGAGFWGLHLVFPEGRAAGRRELVLRRRELRAVLDFAARHRPHFPITLGDELGYLGAWEPWVRDEPFFCGAGRTQCVVLPDGEVVPCTTTDRTVSAGNVRRRSLARIWEAGFRELRPGRLEGRCATCGYAEACGGGCWLQRRNGVHCEREVWSRSRDLVTAAGLAICLGLSGCAAGPGPEGRYGEEHRPARTTVDGSVSDAGEPDASDAAADPSGGFLAAAPGAPRHARRPPASSRPSARPGSSPATLATTAASRPSAAPGGPTQAEHDRAGTLRKPRRIGERDALEVTLLDVLRSSSRADWSGGARKPNAALEREIRANLPGDPAGAYLLDRMSHAPPRGLAARAERIEKALRTPPSSLTFAALLFRDLAEWSLDGTAPARRTSTERKQLRRTLRALEKATRGWHEQILEHKLSPFLERSRGPHRRCVLTKAGHVRFRGDRVLRLLAAKRFPDPRSWRCSTITRELLERRPIGRSLRLELEIEAPRMLLRTSSRGTVSVEGRSHLDLFDVLEVPAGKRPVRVTFKGRRGALKVALPAGAELTWADVLRLTYEQHRAPLDRAARSWYSRDYPRVLLLPAYRARFAALAKKGAKVSTLRFAHWRLLWLWMF